jgi:hypothetical protein
MAFDLEGARKAGYSDAEIADLLARRFNFDIKGARSAGYSDGEVIAQLAGKAGIPGQQTPESPGSTGMLEKVAGAGEAVLSAVSSIPASIGAAGGALGAAAGAIASGEFGTKQAADKIEQAAADAMQGMTYTPRTQTGQAIMGTLGDAMNSIGLPAIGAAQGLRAPAGAMRAGMQAARIPAAAVLDRAATAVPAAVRELPGRVAAAVRPGQAPTPGTMGSVGAAGLDMATQRTTAAQSLPVPVRLTTGQSTRNFEQLRFEGETAKDPRTGAPLREFADQQRADVLANFDRFIDMSGAEAPDLPAAGRSVTGALTKSAARDKAEIRTAYKEAEKAGELSAPVELRTLVDYLNESAPDAATAPLLTTARSWAIKLGIAREEGGRMVPNAAETMPGDSLMNVRPSAGVTLKTAETFRQAVNRNTDFEPTNIRQATILKGLIDQATENHGGDKYRAARALRRKFAEKYEDRAVIADLITNRKGMADPKVAVDKVFQRSILQGSPDDVLFLRRTLQSAGPDGVQAWKEMQGATLRHLYDQATRGAGSDQRGAPLISVAGLDNAVKALDKNGRLPIIFGKQGAQQLRDINDIAKVVNTVPPGAINTSNTASVLLAALTEAGVTGSMTGLPIPVLSGLRAITLQVKDRRIQQRVQAAIKNEALRQQKRAPGNPGAPIQAPGPNTIQ